MTDQMEETARRIAELGGGALLRRLRPAFDHASFTYAGRITIRSDELERMLRQAAHRADAAVWRRALASVAMDELDIGLGAALEHPAVIRAQEIVGAPALVWTALASPSDPAPAVGNGPPGGTDRLPRSEPEPERAATPEPEPEPEMAATPEPEPEPVAPAEPEPEELRASGPVETAQRVPETIRLTAVHLDGIENLPRTGKDLELRFSEAGFDVVDGRGGNVIGRLRWDEIDAVEIPGRRSALGRHRRRTRAQLIVRADRGEASFEVRGLSEVELRQHLEPFLRRQND